MKSISRIIISACLATIIASCATPIAQIEPNSKQEKQILKQYITSKQYGNAIKLLEKRVKKNPSRRNKIYLSKIRNSARKFENLVITKSQAKVKRGDWQSAFIALDDALDLYPESDKIRQYRDQISHQQSNSIKLANIKLLAAKSDYLLRVKPIYAELNRLDPTDSNIQWKLRKTTIEINETSKSLYITGLLEASQNQFKTALKYLELAHQLNPSRKYTRALVKLARKQKIREAQVRKQTQIRTRQLASRPMSNVQKSQQIQLRKLKTKISLHLKSGNYTKAKNLLSEADHISPPLQHEVVHPDIVKLRTEMYKSVSRKVTDLVHMGNEQYSEGNIEQAKKSWIAALKLDPDNKQIKNSVERADRVLSKLREIKKQKVQ